MPVHVEGAWAATGRKPARVGNRHLATAPYDCYRARDGFVAIAVASNKLFRTLAAAIGRPELGEDPDFRGVRGRLARSDMINGMVGAWVAERTVAGVVAALGPDGAGVPCSPVYEVDELLAHPQLVARGMVQHLPHATLGEGHGQLPAVRGTAQGATIRTPIGYGAARLDARRRSPGRRRGNAGRRPGCLLNCAGNGANDGWTTSSLWVQGAKGDVSRTDFGWTNGGVTGLCSVPPERIYCIEQ